MRFSGFSGTNPQQLEFVLSMSTADMLEKGTMFFFILDRVPLMLS